MPVVRENRQRDSIRPGFRIDDRGPIYDEDALLYFLALEWKRAELSGQSLLLLLVDLAETEHPTPGPEINAVDARGIFTALRLSLRETDFIGWYRQGQVAGAVLTEIRKALTSEVSGAVNHRVREALDRHLAPRFANRLRVRLYENPEPELEIVDSARPLNWGHSSIEKGI